MLIVMPLSNLHRIGPNFRHGFVVFGLLVVCLLCSLASWNNLGALLALCWCTPNAFLAHSWCTPGAFLALALLVHYWSGL